MGKIAFLRKISFLEKIILFRDRLMEKYGLFKKKEEFKKRLYFKRVKKEDNKKRKLVERDINNLPVNILNYDMSKRNIIISVTSYGNRVERFLPYALYSMITQELLPNKIVVNIDKNRWNDDNIPTLLKKIRLCGIEINYVTDFGPHTKLLPTLEKYPNDIIVTLDDDIYYDKTVLKELYEAYTKSNKKSVICRAGKLYRGHTHNWAKYSEFPDLNKSNIDNRILPYGVGGVLYPPNIFTNEIFNSDIFRKYCPLADDIWFSVMELRDNIDVVYLKDSSWEKTSCCVDRYEEFNIENSQSLYIRNDLHNKNDEQFDNLIIYYNL